MIDATDIALYFISKDKHSLFNKNIVCYNNRKFYEGNLRLNKYLFLSQVVYLAKYGMKLFKNNFVAYDNGPVIEEIMNSYGRLLEHKYKNNLDDNIISFLDKIYFSLENASYEELIDITHEDPEWIRLKDKTCNAPIMNLESNICEYKKRYKGLIEALQI